MTSTPVTATFFRATVRCLDPVFEGAIGRKEAFLDRDILPVHDRPEGPEGHVGEFHLRFDRRVGFGQEIGVAASR